MNDETRKENDVRSGLEDAKAYGLEKFVKRVERTVKQLCIEQKRLERAIKMSKAPEETKAKLVLLSHVGAVVSDIEHLSPTLQRLVLWMALWLIIEDEAI